MTYKNWNDSVSNLRKLTASVTNRQKEIASIAGIELNDQLPRLVAAARLKEALCFELVQPAGSFAPYRIPHYAAKGLPVKVQRNGLAMVWLK